HTLALAGVKAGMSRTMCPSRASPSRNSRPTRDSTFTTPGSYACGKNVHGKLREMTRGASIAACVFIPKSTTLQTTWTIACDWASSPGQPNGMNAAPSFISSPGFGVSRGRLRGAIADGCPGVVQSCAPRVDTIIPRPGMSGAPSPGSDGVAENAFPSLSSAQTYDVSGAPTPAATSGTYPAGPVRPS